ncbi:MAG TPA: hypothetical protein VJ963_15060, partial [Bacteroidales bacterium]|nr:hypothetical protein [Bacteroidales bacterium]
MQNKDAKISLTKNQIDSIKQETAGKINSDWAFLKKYADDNKSLPAPAKGEKRVVFMGNSITEFWKVLDREFFTSNKS